MASITINGDTSGGITLSAPAVAGSNTQTLAAVAGTLAPIVSGTSVSASGTSVDFTGIPSWVKRITVMFSGVSTNGSSTIIIQSGSGSIETSGYLGSCWVANTTNTLNSSGFLVALNSASTEVWHGSAVLTNIGSNIWSIQGCLGRSAPSATMGHFGGSKTFSGTIDRVRVTTTNGTDTFDAGSINILYE